MSARTWTFWIAACAALFYAGCSDDSETTPDTGPAPVAKENIGGAGGIVEAPASTDLAGTRIEIPSGALSSTQTIAMYVEDDAPPAPSARTAFSAPMRLTPEALTFSQPATLAVVRETSDDDGEGAVIYRASAESWAPILPSTTTGDTIAAKIDRLGVFAAFAGLPPDLGGAGFDPSAGKLGTEVHQGSAFGECAFVRWYWMTKTRENASDVLTAWSPVGSLHAAIADSAQEVLSGGSFDYTDPAHWSRYQAPDAAIALALQVALRYSDSEPQLVGIEYSGGTSQVPEAILVYAVHSANPLEFEVYDPSSAGAKTSVLSFDGQNLSLGDYDVELQFAHLYDYIPAGNALSLVYDRYNGTDTTPPAAIGDLVATAVSADAIELTWTAPGDDMNAGTADSYDIRYSTTSPEGHPTWWADATVVADPSPPQPAGSTETHTVHGLTPCTEYFFAIKAADEMSNEQPEYSNVDSATPFCGNCASALAAARTALEQEAYKHRRPEAPDPEFPDDVDFTEAEEHYNAALGLCPAGSAEKHEAHFGMALTGLLTLSMDPEINAAFDEWKEFLEEGGPFSVESRAGQPLGVPLMLDESRNPVEMPLDIVLYSAVRWTQAALMEADPKVSTIQEILLERVLPLAQETLSHLEQIADEEDFIFWITPMMQGDLDADPEEVDHTDVLLLCSACRLLMAGCHVAVAYDLSVASYDLAGIHTALDRATGTMLRLREGGQEHMAAVLPECSAAATTLDEAITSLLAETDNQANDMVKIGPRDLDREDVIEFQNLHLPKIAAALAGPTTYTRDWDNDPGTPDVAMTVDIHAFFSDPAEDLKLLAPNYTVETEHRPWGEFDEIPVDEAMHTAPIAIAETGEYYAYVNLYAYDYEIETWGYGDDEALVEAIQQAVTESAWLEDIQSNTSWNGELSVSVNFSGTLPAGSQQVAFTATGEYEVAEFIVDIPVVVWGANTYEEWATTFPDPTLNGLLPTTTSVLSYLQMFDPAGWDEWEKRIELDWTGINWME